MWSINENYSFTAFIITSVLLATGTYFLVGNIERVVYAAWTGYQFFKKPLLRKMGEDPNWAETPKKFRRFPPDREDIRPSKWLLVWYGIVWAWSALMKLGASNEATESQLPHLMLQQMQRVAWVKQSSYLQVRPARPVVSRF